MNVLIDEYPLVVLPTLACQYGLNEAIVIQQIHYWTQKNKPMSDGFVWVYNSIPEWKRQFPFWSERTIFSILKNLKNLGLVIAERKSDNPYDQTLYYRLDHEKFGISISQTLQDRKSKTCDINNTDITIDYNFENFWKAYPKKVSKVQAIKSWKKLKINDDIYKKIIKAIDDQKLFYKDKQFVPNPATWLNNRRWEDEVVEKQQTAMVWK